MGIQGLAKLIADIAPWAIKETEIKNYFGRKIAVDASEYFETVLHQTTGCNVLNYFRYVSLSVFNCCSS